MNAVASIAAAAAASPYALDPVGTRRGQREFADDPINPTKFGADYVGYSLDQDPLAALFGVRDERHPRMIAASEAAGYDADDAFLIVANASMFPRGEDGALSVEGGELYEQTDEMWVAFANQDGNDFGEDEVGSLTDEQVTLVRVI